MQDRAAELLSQLAKEDFCYLTTIGRVSGKSHQIEIWFGARESTIYLMAGNHRSDWVLNSLQDPHVTVRIAGHHFNGTAHLVSDEQEQMAVRHLLAQKYNEWDDDGSTLSEWARTALVVGFDLLLAESE